MNLIQDNKSQPSIVPFDVYLGRGNGVARKLGNRIYRQTIKVTKAIYRDARGNKAKAKVAMDLIRFIQKQGGTFYFKVKDMYEVAPNAVILSKVKQALREKYQSLTDNEDEVAAPQVQLILNNIIDNNSGIKASHQVRGEICPKTPTFRKTKGCASIIERDNTVKEAITWDIDSADKATNVAYEENYNSHDDFDEHSFSSNDSSHHHAEQILLPSSSYDLKQQTIKNEHEQAQRNSNIYEFKSCIQYNQTSSTNIIPELITSHNDNESVAIDSILCEDIGPIEPNDDNVFNELPSDIMEIIFQDDEHEKLCYNS